MTLKYESDLLHDIMVRDGVTPSSQPLYESELKEKYIAEVIDTYPKVCDYRAEWLNFYYHDYHPSELLYQHLSGVTHATIENAIPFYYKSASLKGSTKYRDIDTGEILESFEEGKNLEFVSVKMPGLSTSNTNNLWCVDELLPDVVDYGGFRNKSSDFIPVNEGETIWFNLGVIVYTWARFYQEDKTQISEVLVAGHSAQLGAFDKMNHVVPENAKFMKVIVRENYIDSMMVNRGNDYLPYEKGKPYKSTRLTTPSDLVMRGVGEVKDELNLLTGEVTERVGEIVFDGSEKWGVKDLPLTPSNKTFYLPLGNTVDHSLPAGETRFVDTLGFTNNISSHTNQANFDGKKAFAKHTDGNIYFSIPTNELSSPDLSGWRDFLNKQRLTLLYPLKEKANKSVDLTIESQGTSSSDEFRPFEGTIHFNTTSETILPTLEIECPVEAIAPVNLASFIDLE